MNGTIETIKANAPSLPGAGIDRVRSYLGGRRGLILLTVAVLGTGMVLNWSWLVALGVAPLLLALAPCAAMCALGLCMKKKAGTPSTDTASGAPNAPANIDPKG